MKAKRYTRETINSLGVVERNFPDFEVGDVIAVSQRIKEGDKERLQVFEGDVLAISNNGISSTFIVRKIGADSVAVERIYPYYSPVIDSITLVRKGKVRRAKLYYMRKRVGKAARVQEKVITRSQREQKAEAAAQVEKAS
ncbi:MAG TPA: 50S ribosomal protein L19 [Candidatus Babeliales bacterium]|nr:50S ribosomal protein L19 [Candidatus Babeliales bacterium]